MRRSTVAILLLLMLAIPFQGFAAAAMQSGCALGQQRTNSGVALQQQDGVHDHAAMLAAAAQADTGADAKTGTACECMCGTCGAGTGLFVSRAVTTVALPYAAPLGRFADPPIVMITSGPERPPRNILA